MTGVPRLCLTLPDVEGGSDGKPSRRLSVCALPAPHLSSPGAVGGRRASFCPSSTSLGGGGSLLPTPTADGATGRRLSVCASPTTARRLSSSALLQEPSLSNYAAAAAKAREAQAVSNTRRKISQAGHSLVANTLGWRLGQPVPHLDTIVCQSKSLCGRYIRNRVRACCLPGAHQKKLGFQRLKSITNLAASLGTDLTPVYSRINCLAAELEKGHPKLYGSVTANVGYKALTNETSVRSLVFSVSSELFRTEINWGRIVALFVVSGALAVDCVQLGRPEFVLGLVEEVGNCIDVMHVAAWIANQGGWEALLSQFRRCRRGQIIKILIHICVPLAFGLLVIWSY